MIYVYEVLLFYLEEQFRRHPKDSKDFADYMVRYG